LEHNVEKMESRLAGRKQLYLPKGGRITLIKNTLSNLPTYYLSMFPITVGVANCIEKLQKGIFVGWSDDVFKFRLVSC
jgi:hypothetical protein